jgi:CRP-like cAMP-binding protein
MANAQPSASPFRNTLLNKLSPELLDALIPSLQRETLDLRQVLYEPYRPIEYAYFPESGMVSVVTIMQNGDSIEVGTIGREGMAGAALVMEANDVPCRYFIQVAGEAHRIDARTLKKIVDHHPELRRLILRYESAILTQSMLGAACNGLHNVEQRCCRWLLMARDRSDSDEIFLTHEFLALMLGVRRASVTDVLRPLQDAGLVTSQRGTITVLNRAGLEKGACECYRLIVDQFHRMLA